MLPVALIDSVPHLLHKRLVELLVLKQLAVGVGLSGIALLSSLAEDIGEDAVDKLVFIIACCLLGQLLGRLLLDEVEDAFHHHSVGWREIAPEHDVHLVNDVVEEVAIVFGLVAPFWVFALDFGLVTLERDVLHLVGLDGVVHQPDLFVEVHLLVRGLWQYPVEVVGENVGLHE